MDVMNNKIIYGSDGITILEQWLDNGDDTAVWSKFESGKLVASETVEWQSHDKFAENETVSIPKSAITQLADAMTDPSINSIAEVKMATSSFVESIK